MLIHVSKPSKISGFGFVLMCAGLFYPNTPIGGSFDLFVIRLLMISGFALLLAAAFVAPNGFKKFVPVSLQLIFANPLLSALAAWVLFFLFYLLNIDATIPYSALSSSCCTAIVWTAFFIWPRIEANSQNSLPPPPDFG